MSFIIWQGSPLREILAFSFILSWSGFRHVISCVFKLLLSKAGKFKTSMTQVPYNKPRTNLAFSSRTREYSFGPRSFFGSVRTATTSDPSRPSRSVSKRLVFAISYKTQESLFPDSSDKNIFFGNVYFPFFRHREKKVLYS